ncbi:hypothetical protein F4779DRAFT_85820 [Xylariaceae sp. FL0662B]|nr:hypothetical protein F4779DRAFT_85820 [Xylariaceae sp. FL0662B]
MLSPKAILSLSPALLLLFATELRAQQQPEHPTAIKKMSLDEGEKIFPEYYAFAPQAEVGASLAQSPLLHMRSHAEEEEEEEEEEADEEKDAPLLVSGNNSSSSSATIPFRPPFPRHYDYDYDRKPDDGREGPYRRAREVLARLRGRQFACPDGTHNCDNIGQPNYCCTTGTTCFVVANAPDAGNVGCCPEGQNCGGSVGACTDGSTACPAEVGGGCCIPGFACADVGCVSSTVSIITRTTTSSTVLTSPTPTTELTTVIVTQPTTTTQQQQPSPSPSPSPSPTDSSTPTTTAATTGGIPPYRPTSGTSTLDTSTAPTDTYCPTGFYACVASAGGGCCRTGRDCSTTSCPAIPSTTITTANGVTVVVPVTDATAAAAASFSPTCAEGWFLCGSDAGPVAGCCPSGYACGTASCTLSTTTATATVQKALPNAGSWGRGRGRASAVLVAGAAAALVLALGGL